MQIVPWTNHTCGVGSLTVIGIAKQVSGMSHSEVTDLPGNHDASMLLIIDRRGHQWTGGQTLPERKSTLSHEFAPLVSICLLIEIGFDVLKLFEHSIGAKSQDRL